MGRKRLYFTDEEKKAAKRAREKIYYRRRKALKPQNKTKKNKSKINYINNPLIERETAYTDLYTLYELQHIEELFPGEMGRINWNLWNYLVNKLRNTL